MVIVPQRIWLSIIESIQLCTPPDSAEHQLLWYCIPWECHCSYVPVLHISICIHHPIESTIMYYQLYIFIDQLIVFEPLSPFFILRHCYEHGYVLLVHIHVWDYMYLIHSWEEIQTKIHCISNEETPLLRSPLRSLHHCHHFSLDPMMSIVHTMSSCPHTLGGNLFTPKNVHLSLHGLNYNHTSYSHHYFLHFELHN